MKSASSLKLTYLKTPLDLVFLKIPLKFNTNWYAVNGALGAHFQLFLWFIRSNRGTEWMRSELKLKQGTKRMEIRHRRCMKMCIEIKVH